MYPSRSAIFTALFNLLRGVADWNFTSQRFIPWTQVSASQMPMLIMWELGERYDWRAEPLSRVTLLVNAIAYLVAPEDQSVVPVQAIDNLLDDIDAAVAPQTPLDRQYGRQTLGGLVYNCRIEGEVVKAAGDIDGISALVVPFRIMVPAPTN